MNTFALRVVLVGDQWLKDVDYKWRCRQLVRHSTEFDYVEWSNVKVLCCVVLCAGILF